YHGRSSPRLWVIRSISSGRARGFICIELTGLPGTKFTMANVRKVTPSSRGIICNSLRTMNPITRPDPAGAVESSRPLVVQAGSERVTQSQSHQVGAERGEEDHEAGEKDERPRLANELLRFLQHVAPGRLRRLHAETEIAECCFGEDKSGNGKRGKDDELRN